MESIRKYPRTPHLTGSRRQPGDEGLATVALRHLWGQHLVVEEKLDGANAGISFVGGELWLQSRGHRLVGGSRERHFDLFKTWATSHADRLWALLGERYLLYGEWLYAKHTIYYNALPHYFVAFDLLDREEDLFLSTPRRRALLAEHRYLAPVRTLFEGTLRRDTDLTALLGPSAHIRGAHLRDLRERAAALGLDPEPIVRETDPSRAMEGLYLKVEADGAVVERCKYVRRDFLTTVERSESHWLDRPIVPNRLADGVDLFARP